MREDCLAILRQFLWFTVHKKFSDMVESARVESDSVQDVWKIDIVHFLGDLVFKEQVYDTFL